MKSWGVWLIIFAIGSALLPMIGMQFILMSWVDLWGTTIGWVIRAAMVVAGIAMLAAGSRGSGSGNMNSSERVGGT